MNADRPRLKALLRARDTTDSLMIAQGIARTARSRADAKTKGVKFGRKPKLSLRQMRETIQRCDVDEEALLSIARSYNVSATTI